MKKAAFIFLSLIFIYVLFSSRAFAQNNKSIAENSNYTASDIYPFGVGLALSFKGGVNTQDSPGGVKNAYVFTAMPDIGAQVYIPFGIENNMGVILDLAYITYPYKFKLYGDENINWIDKAGYFSIAPNFHLSGFLFGFNFGIPITAESGNDIIGNKFTYPVDKDNLKFLVDVHVGALIPLVNTNTGRLNLYIQAEYALSKIFEEDLVTNSDINEGTQTFNTQPVAIKFGLSYIFNTSLMQKK